MYKKRIWTVSNNIFKVIITLIALYWVSTKISFNDLKEAFENCSPGYFLLGLLSYAISQIIASSRLNTFLQAIGLNVSERYNMRLYQLGLLYNFFLPGGIGGDGYKIYFLKKNHNIRGRKILSAVFFDRLSGLWALGIITGVLVMFMPRLEIPNTVTIACLVLGSATYLYVMHLFFRNFFKRFIETHIKALAVQGFQVLSAVAILYAMNFQGKFSPYLLIFLLSSLVAIVPSILGGVGLRESLMTFGAEYFQLDSHLAVLISLVFYVISLLIATSGIYYIIRPSRLGTDRMPSATEVEQELEKEE